jgi:hypothetical protein
VPADADRNSSPFETEQVPLLAPLLLCGASLCFLLSVALWNGYPIVFSDTGSYVLTGATLIPFRPFRAPGYSILIRLTSLGATPWMTILAQAAIVFYVLHKTCSYLMGGRTKFQNYIVLAGICVLSILTSLPWLVSQLMPDVFVGVLFLSAFLLAFDDRLSLIGRICLATILAISVSTHMSFLPIALVFCAAQASARLIGRNPSEAPSFRAMLAWLLLPVILSGLFTAGLNRKMGLGFQLSPSRNMFLLARLFDEGLAADFLIRNCPNHPYIACRYLSKLPRTDAEFLFQHPLLNDLSSQPQEMEEIVHGTLAAYPVRFIAASFKNTLLQLGTFKTGDEIRSYSARDWNNGVFQRVFPAGYGAFSNSRQLRGRLTFLADRAAMLHTAACWLSLPICLLFAWNDRKDRLAGFLAWTMVFLIINAAVCATFSGVYDRYQSRVAWLIPFCFFSYVCRLLTESSKSDAREEIAAREFSTG